MCFIGDLLFLLSNFQKRLQSDHITIIDLPNEVTKFQKKLAELLDKPMIGGWEEALKHSMTNDGILHGIQLWQKERRAIQRNLFVSEPRSFVAIRLECIQAMRHFTESRLALDDGFSSPATLFANFQATDDDIRTVHKKFAPDLDLAAIKDQYSDIQDLHNRKPARQVLKDICQLDQFSELATVLSRIIVCKPHSADCERSISAYNLLKTTNRSCLNRQTISNYLHININMPPLSAFDPRPAVLKWLKLKNRRVKETPKANEQEWMKSVFYMTSETEVSDKSESKLIHRAF